MLFKSNTDFEILDKNTNWTKFSSYVTDAEQKYILGIIGEELMTYLQAQFDAVASAGLLPLPLQALLAKIQAPLRNLTMYIGIPKMSLRFNDLGVMKAVSQDYEGATGGEVYFGRLQFLIDGYSGLDALYQFLETNKADYPLWTDSPEYTQFMKYFINSTSVFSKHVSAVSNRYLFSKMLAQMDTVEKLRVKGFIGADFFEDLKEKFAADNLSEEETALLFGDDANSITGLVKPIALFTFADCLTDPTVLELIRVVNATTADDLSTKGVGGIDYKEQYYRLAENKRDEAAAFMAQIKTYLNATASDTVFSVYYDSDKYKDPDAETIPEIQNYDNDASTSTFACI